MLQSQDFQKNKPFWITSTIASIHFLTLLTEDLGFPKRLLPTFKLTSPRGVHVTRVFRQGGQREWLPAATRLRLSFAFPSLIGDILTPIFRCRSNMYCRNAVQRFLLQLRHTNPDVGIYTKSLHAITEPSVCTAVVFRNKLQHFQRIPNVCAATAVDTNTVGTHTMWFCTIAATDTNIVVIHSIWFWAAVVAHTNIVGMHTMWYTFCGGRGRRNVPWSLKIKTQCLEYTTIHWSIRCFDCHKPSRLPCI